MLTKLQYRQKITPIETIPVSDLFLNTRDMTPDLLSHDIDGGTWRKNSERKQ